MAPEQARGKAVDRRADVWAFGVVLYEMLTGRRAFEGAEVSDVLASVLRQEIDWNALPADTPAQIRRLLHRCLERDRAERLSDMSAARLEIKEAIGDSAGTGVCWSGGPGRDTSKRAPATGHGTDYSACHRRSRGLSGAGLPPYHCQSFGR